MNSQRGFLLIVAIVLLVIIGILSSAIVSLGVRAGIMPIYFNAKNKAVFLAESGLEQGKKNLTEKILANRQTCVGLSNTTTMTGGKFKVVQANDAANTINPRYAFSTLSANISVSGTPGTITVTDSSVFAPYGRVLIGREVFQYDRIQNTTTLAGITRAQDGSIAHAHISGTLVSQNQCTIKSTGNSPATSPVGIRQYRQGIQQPTVFTAGLNGTILRWNAANELQWDVQSPGTYNFNAISVINYHDGWAVADRESLQINRLARLQGNGWTNFTLDMGSANQAQNLYGVYATSANEAWAVGLSRPPSPPSPPDGGGPPIPPSGPALTILNWVRDGSNSNTNWCIIPNGGTSCNGKIYDDTGVANTAKDLFAIKTIDYSGDGFADVGFAAGGNDGQAGSGANRGTLLTYNGSQWSNVVLPANSIGQLYGVDIIKNGTNAPVDAYFVGMSSMSGEGGKMIRLRSGAWSVSTTTAQMNAISGVDTNNDGLADFVVAVGNGGLVYFFDSNFAITANYTLSGNLNGVIVLSPSDVWVAGSGGVRWHYNGSNWLLNASGGNDLKGISAVFPEKKPQSSWYDAIDCLSTDECIIN